MLKTCKLCKKDKPIEEFNRRFNYRDNTCRNCRLPTLRGGRPWTYPWDRESFTIEVNPGETTKALQHRIGQMTHYRKHRHGERWKTKQLWKAVKVTRIA